jgi:hypothetical protein
MAQYTTYHIGPLAGLVSRLGAAIHANPEPLLIQWRKRIEVGNKRGILARTDANGQHLEDAKYRPRGESQKFGLRQQKKFLRGKTEPGHNNLTSAQYRRLAGPGTAPRGPFSRVITNLLTGHGYDSSRGVYFSEGWWADVESATGYQFLEDLFEGRGRYGPIAKRELRGVRPNDLALCRQDLIRYGSDLLKKVVGA